MPQQAGNPGTMQKLNPYLFQNITLLWSQPEIYLFAILLTCETPKDYSWRLDPDSLKVNVFQQSQEKIKGHAFPSFYLIGRVPSRIRREKCTTIVIIPVWQTQPRQTLLLNMSIQNLILLPQIEIFLKNAQEKMHPLTSPKASIKTSGLDHISKSLSTTALSKQAIELISVDRRKHSIISNSTLAWRKFCSWSCEQKVGPF